MTDETLQDAPVARPSRLFGVGVDIATVAGVVSITYGAGLIYVPAGFIVGGMLVLIAAFLASRNEAAG